MSFLLLDLTMADAEDHEVKKGFFSWLWCAGGCKRKTLQKPKQAATKLTPKTPSRTSSCFGELWRCMRCLMNRKKIYQVGPEPVEDGGMNDEEKSSKNEVSEKRDEDAVSSRNPIENFLIVPFESSCSDELQADLQRLPVKKSKRVTKRVPKLPERLELNQLEYVKTLGKGGFGYVELVTLTKNRKKSFALKSMVKDDIVNKKLLNLVFNERDIMMEANSPFIARLYCTFKDEKYVYMLLELCLGGNMKTVLKEKICFFSNDDARFYIACALLALEYLHAKGIVHRDLKPSNMLLDSSGYLKLIDFGMSEKIGDDKVRQDCGTSFYKAPEVFMGETYGLFVDYWSLGVIMYEFLVGRRPFREPCLYEKVLKGIDQVQYPHYVEENEAKDLVGSLCKADASSRLGRHGAEEVKQHEWFKEFKWDALASRKMKAPIDPKIKSPTDSHNYNECPKRNYVPPDENSGWDSWF